MSKICSKHTALNRCCQPPCVLFSAARVDCGKQLSYPFPSSTSTGTGMSHVTGCLDLPHRFSFFKFKTGKSRFPRKWNTAGYYVYFPYLFMRISYYFICTIKEECMYQMYVCLTQPNIICKTVNYTVCTQSAATNCCWKAPCVPLQSRPPVLNGWCGYNLLILLSSATAPFFSGEPPEHYTLQTKLYHVSYIY